jgi:hypothetical protein
MKDLRVMVALWIMLAVLSVLGTTNIAAAAREPATTTIE